MRGLDYYTRTTFEFNSDRLGAQSGVGGGGRYDGLVEQIGGQPTPGVGWGSGLERIALAMREPLAVPASTGVYVVAFDDDVRPAAFAVAESLRRAGVPAELDLAGRSPKGQLKQAGRSGARYAVLLGPGRAAPTASCGSRTWPAAGKRTSPPPTCRRSSPTVSKSEA